MDHLDQEEDALLTDLQWLELITAHHSIPLTNRRGRRASETSLFSFSSGSEDEDPSETATDYNVVPIHKHPELIDQGIRLINDEWPRTRISRLWSLESSRDTLPMSLVATKYENRVVIGHLRLCAIPAEPEAAVIESMVVAKKDRGKGIGRYLMYQAEKYAEQTLGLRMIYVVIANYDVIMFYRKLGYEYCDPVNCYGDQKGENTVTRKTFMRKVFLDTSEEFSLEHRRHSLCTF